MTTKEALENCRRCLAYLESCDQLATSESAELVRQAVIALEEKITYEGATEDRYQKAIARRQRTQVILKYAILSVLGMVLCFAGTKIAYMERGYFAIGGETLVLLLPVFYYIVSTMVRDVIAECRKSKDSPVSDRSPKKRKRRKRNGPQHPEVHLADGPGSHLRAGRL